MHPHDLQRAAPRRVAGDGDGIVDDDDDDARGYAPELLASHHGHRAGRCAPLNDVSWCPSVEWVCASVDERNTLQVCQSLICRPPFLFLDSGRLLI